MPWGPGTPVQICNVLPYMHAGRYWKGRVGRVTSRCGADRSGDPLYFVYFGNDHGPPRTLQLPKSCLSELQTF